MKCRSRSICFRVCNGGFFWVLEQHQGKRKCVKLIFSGQPAIELKLEIVLCVILLRQNRLCNAAVKSCGVQVQAVCCAFTSVACRVLESMQSTGLIQAQCGMTWTAHQHVS